MGAIYSTIFRISPEDKRNLYVFAFGINKLDDVHDWLEEKFVKVSTALGVEGLFVMAEDKPLDPDLSEAYGKINSIPLGGRGFLVSNVNPYKIQETSNEQRPEVLFIPIIKPDRDELARLVDQIVNAAKSNNISLLRPLSKSLNQESNQSIANLVISNASFKPSFVGFGFDVGNFTRELIKRLKR
ncbi:MAG: hypothetical protein HYR76_05565 [Ignavibacteria bacterium]|nr:hypothetical protein [Ignavibacteria bacterium]